MSDLMTEIPHPIPVVLMVDDTPANLGVLYELLSEVGYTVLVAEDGARALERVAYARPDLNPAGRDDAGHRRV